jgi:glycosyltransferase involved in cell wall biosynthesis
LVTGQTVGIIEDIRRRFPDKKVLLFPNGVDVGAFAGPLDRAGVRQEFAWAEGVFVIGYTGVLGHAQALGQVLDAAKLLGSDFPVHFAFFGDGPCREELVRRIEGEGLRTAKVYPHQPTVRMPHIQAALDAGLVPLARGSLFEGARPSKMFEIMAAGRPLVLCARGESVQVMASAPGGPAGLAAPPEEPVHLAECVRSLVSDRPRAREMGARGASLVRERFDRERIALDLEAALLKLVGAPQTGGLKQAIGKGA